MIETSLIKKAKEARKFECEGLIYDAYDLLTDAIYDFYEGYLDLNFEPKTRNAILYGSITDEYGKNPFDYKIADHKKLEDYIDDINDHHYLISDDEELLPLLEKNNEFILLSEINEKINSYIKEVNFEITVPTDIYKDEIVGVSKKSYKGNELLEYISPNDFYETDIDVILKKSQEIEEEVEI